jgi:hypothetical protein
MPRVGLEKLELPEPEDLERVTLDMLVREIHDREDAIALNMLINRTTESTPINVVHGLIDVVQNMVLPPRKSILVDAHGRNLCLE